MIAHSLFLPHSAWSGRWAKLNLMRFSLSELFSITPFYFKHSLTACILYQHWVQICSRFPSHTLPLPQWSKFTSLLHLIGSQSSFCCSFQSAFPSTCLQQISCVTGLSHCLCFVQVWDASEGPKSFLTALASRFSHLTVHLFSRGFIIVLIDTISSTAL